MHPLTPQANPLKFYPGPHKPSAETTYEDLLPTELAIVGDLSALSPEERNAAARDIRARCEEPPITPEVILLVEDLLAEYHRPFDRTKWDKTVAETNAWFEQNPWWMEQLALDPTKPVPATPPPGSTPAAAAGAGANTGQRSGLDQDPAAPKD